MEDDPFQARARQNILERQFAGIARASDAAETLILLDKPEFRENLALIVVGLHLPGLCGPSFVNELTSRFPAIPVLVIGRIGEIAPDYAGEKVRFLPHHASSQDVLEGCSSLLSEFLIKVA